jgi:HK97 gp10 family phage protein
MARNSQFLNLEMGGYRELDAAIRKLPGEMQKSAYRAVIGAGAAPIRKAAKRFARSSKDSGLLIKSIGIKSMIFKSNIPYAVIGSMRNVAGMVTRRGAMEPTLARPSNYAHLVEYGTSKSAAKPFMRPAVDAAKGEVLAEMAKGLDRYLTRAVRKLRRGTK